MLLAGVEVTEFFMIRYRPKGADPKLRRNFNELRDSGVPSMEDLSFKERRQHSKKLVSISTKFISFIIFVKNNHLFDFYFVILKATIVYLNLRNCLKQVQYFFTVILKNLLVRSYRSSSVGIMRAWPTP